ncbi:MAG TPA: right-handed parallel beta-helix repeat-containing protein [Patescibacteria group bacterium]|nr:right-handed parallel beta-helix repeat-containing protein [Patescibacteria group bacterium]
MNNRNFWLSKEVFLTLCLGLFLAVPVFVFGGSETIFVDKDADGTESGTEAHPYRTISKALRHADKGTKVQIKGGTYKENITIPKGVDILGKSNNRDKVVIESDNDNQPTVTMKHDTALSHITIKGGRHGVRIVEDARAHIFNVVIKKSERDGIHIDAAPRDKKYRVFIDKTRITNNDRAGIFSEKRFIVIVNSDIVSNGSDGVDLAAGTKAWFEDNRFNDNDGSGAKMVLDGADIWTKKNSFRNNKREGVEINAFGASGNIGFKKATFINNGRYGIAKVARTYAGTKTFGGLVLGTGVNNDRFEHNAFGNISSIIRVQ